MNFNFQKNEERFNEEMRGGVNRKKLIDIISMKRMDLTHYLKHQRIQIL